MLSTAPQDLRSAYTAGRPPCEIRTERHSLQCCGCTAVAYVLFSLAHYLRCPERENERPRYWLCRRHLEVAMAGNLFCNGCTRRLVFRGTL